MARQVDKIRQRGFESQHNDKVLFLKPTLSIWSWSTYWRNLWSSRFIKKKSHWLIIVTFQRQKIGVRMSAHHTRLKTQPRRTTIRNHLSYPIETCGKGRVSNETKMAAGFTLTWRWIYEKKTKSQIQPKMREYNQILKLLGKKTYLTCWPNSWKS